MKYEIRIRGIIDPGWTHRFQEMSVGSEGADISVIRGELTDQAALHGLLKKIRDTGIPLISVNPIEEGEDI